MTTQEKNEVIAKWMGAKYDPDWGRGRMPDPGSWVYAMDNRPTPHSCCNWTSETLEYHSSWDWLMPVVRKITAIAFDVGQQAWSDTSGALLRGNIDVVHERAFKFIEWYNANIKQS